MIQRERLTANLEGNFVVFLIGMRINNPWKVHKWLPCVLPSVPRRQGEILRGGLESLELGGHQHALLGDVQCRFVSYERGAERGEGAVSLETTTVITSKTISSVLSERLFRRIAPRKLIAIRRGSLPAPGV